MSPGDTRGIDRGLLQILVPLWFGFVCPIPAGRNHGVHSDSAIVFLTYQKAVYECLHPKKTGRHDSRLNEKGCAPSREKVEFVYCHSGAHEEVR